MRSVASVVAFLTSWPSKEIAVKEFSSIQSCPSSVIRRMSIPWLWAASCSPLGPPGVPGRTWALQRNRRPFQAGGVQLSQNEDAVIIKLSLGGLVQVWKAPKCLWSAPGFGMWRRMDHVLQLGPPPMKTTRPCFAAVQRALWSISWSPFGPDRRMSTATTMLERCG